jgi:hypothetical protein
VVERWASMITAQWRDALWILPDKEES